MCTSLGITRSPFSLALWGMGSLPGTTNYGDLKQCQQMTLSFTWPGTGHTAVEVLCPPALAVSLPLSIIISGLCTLPLCPPSHKFDI